MKAKYVLPAVIASAVACISFNSGLVHAKAMEDAGFNDVDFFGCVLSATMKSEDTITDDDLAALESLTCGYSEGSEAIRDLTGIEKMTGLKNLTLFKTLLTSADLSKNTALEKTMIYKNKNLSSIVLPESVPDSNQFLLYQNALTSIDFSHLANLKYVIISDNQLSSIDVSHNPMLQTLHAYGNNITSIDISNIDELLNLVVDRDVDVYSLVEPSEENVYDLSQLVFLRDYDVEESDSYTLDTDASTDPATITLTANPDKFTGTLRLTSGFSYGGDFNLHLTAAPIIPDEGDDEGDEGDDEGDPESLPETDTSEKEEKKSSEKIPSNPKTADSNMSFILLGEAVGLTTCLIALMLVNRRRE